MWLDAVCWVYISIILLSFVVFKNGKEIQDVQSRAVERLLNLTEQFQTNTEETSA